MIEIEKGVPIPVNGITKNRYPLEQMEVGDSFFVAAPTPEKFHSVRQSIYQHAQRRRPKIFKLKKAEGGVRCWRIQ